MLHLTHFACWIIKGVRVMHECCLAMRGCILDFFITFHTLTLMMLTYFVFTTITCSCMLWLMAQKKKKQFNFVQLHWYHNGFLILEQLDRIEEDMDKINADMKEAEKNLTG